MIRKWEEEKGLVKIWHGTLHVKTIRVTLERNLTFRPDITNFCKSWFLFLSHQGTRGLRTIRSALTKNMSQTIAHLSHLFYYANLPVVGLSYPEVKRLQRIQT